MVFVKQSDFIVSSLGLIGLLLGSIWLTRTNHENVTPVIAEGQQETDHTAGVDETAIELVEPEAGIDEKTVTPGSADSPDSWRAEVTQAVTDTDERFVHVPDAMELIQRAEAGSLVAAVDFLKKFRECKSAGSIRSKATAMSDLMEQTSIDLGLEIPENLTRQAWLNKAEDAESDCLHFMVGENGNVEGAANNLIEDIENKATTGNTMMRFMYSMWGPEDRASVLSAGTVLEYESRSREFTDLNMMDDPKLALLALGISYSAGNYFTPFRLQLGRAYLWAAGICGIDQSVVDGFLGQYASLLSLKERFGQAEIVGEIEVKELSTIISAAACPISLDE